MYILPVLIALFFVYKFNENIFSFKTEKEKEDELKYDKEYLATERERFENQQKFSQELEDRQHYSNYKLKTISYLQDRNSGSDFNTKILVHEHPEYLEEVTDADLEEYKEHYDLYLKHHKAFFNSDFYKGTKLSEKEHIIKYKYSYKTFRGVCSGFEVSTPRVYTIYDYDIAEFKNNNSLKEKFDKEFNLT